MNTQQNDLHVLFRQEGYPVFQNRMFDTLQDAMNCTRGDVVLVQDKATGLVRNAAFDSQLVVYDGNYQNEQANSDAFRTHLANVADLIFSTMNVGNLCEIGCGKGGFLDSLAQRGAHVVGFDPAYEGDNPDISRSFFTRDSGISADGIVLRHVLEHIEDPVNFLYAIRDANGGKGLIYIEVPCFDWIVANKCWFDVFYEHVNYFRLSDFENMFGELVHGGRGFGGQYLMIVADLAKLRRPVHALARPAKMPPDFMPDTNMLKQRLKSPVAIWGGASKGVIFSILLQKLGVPVACMIDVNPAKQGRFVAVSGHRIVSPAEGLRSLPGGATICVMNPMYHTEIAAMAGPGFNYVAPV